MTPQIVMEWALACMLVALAIFVAGGLAKALIELFKE